MKKPTPLPDLSIVEANFTYDPISGELYRTKSDTPVRTNDRTSECRKVRIGRKTTQVARVAWYLFYREDPINHRIEHIDKNPFNNRIENLRKVKL